MQRNNHYRPAFFSEEDYLVEELAINSYDAIIVAGLSDAFFSSSYAVRYTLPDLPEKEMISSEEYGKDIRVQGISLGRCNGASLIDERIIPLDDNDDKITLEGWAADFYANRPLSELYLTVGDIVLKCNYGIAHPRVAKHYGEDALLNCGFKITFSSAILKDKKTDEISFVGVSADGTTLYSPASYRFSYS